MIHFAKSAYSPDSNSNQYNIACLLNLTVIVTLTISFRVQAAAVY